MGTSGEDLDNSSGNTNTSSSSTTGTNANNNNTTSSSITDTNITDTGNTKPEEKKGLFDNFLDTIRKEIRDLSYIEVVTAIGDVKANVNPDAELVILGLNKDAEVTIKARTRIELDGDVMVWLPVNKKEQEGEITINQQIMDIHKENVALAVQNWNQFITNIFEVLKTIMHITGRSDTQIKEELDKPLPPKSPAEEKLDQAKTDAKTKVEEKKDNK
jgi:hypothetical protein